MEQLDMNFLLNRQESENKSLEMLLNTFEKNKKTNL